MQCIYRQQTFQTVTEPVLLRFVRPRCFRPNSNICTPVAAFHVKEKMLKIRDDQLVSLLWNFVIFDVAKRTWCYLFVYSLFFLHGSCLFVDVFSYSLFKKRIQFDLNIFKKVFNNLSETSPTYYLKWILTACCTSLKVHLSYQRSFGNFIPKKAKVKSWD